MPVLEESDERSSDAIELQMQQFRIRNSKHLPASRPNRKPVRHGRILVGTYIGKDIVDSFVKSLCITAKQAAHSLRDMIGAFALSAS